MVNDEMLGLAAKYGQSDEKKGLLGILYGHVLCRKFSCSLSFFTVF